MQHDVQLVQVTAAALGISGATDTGAALGKPFQSKILLVPHARVAGADHIDGIYGLAAGLEPGMRLGFTREPENARDRWSIRVCDPQGRKIGYVPCDRNEILARLMDAGKLVFGEVLAVERRGVRQCIEMEVYLDD